MISFKTIIIHCGKADIKDEKSRGSMSRNTGQDQLSLLETPGIITWNFAKMQRTLHCMCSESDMTGEVMEGPLCTQGSIRVVSGLSPVWFKLTLRVNA